jgi:hypothetical protein
MHPDQRYLIGLLQNQKPVLDDLHQHVRPVFLDRFQQMGSSEEEGDRIFEKSLEEVHQLGQTNAIQLSIPFIQFLSPICLKEALLGIQNLSEECRYLKAILFREKEDLEWAMPKLEEMAHRRLEGLNGTQEEVKSLIEESMKKLQRSMKTTEFNWTNDFYELFAPLAFSLGVKNFKGLPHEYTYLKSLLHNDPAMMKQVERRFRKPIIKMLTKMGAKFVEAEEVYMDGLVVIWNMCKRPGFYLQSTFFNLFASICYKKGLKTVKKRHRNDLAGGELMKIFPAEEYIDDTSINEEMKRHEEYLLYREKFDELSDTCRRLITYYLEGKNPRDYFKELDYSSAQSASQALYQCRTRLAGNIQSDPRF